MFRQEQLLSAIGLAVCAVVIVLAIGVYVSPEMLMEFASIRFCS